MTMRICDHEPCESVATMELSGKTLCAQHAKILSQAERARQAKSQKDAQHKGAQPKGALKSIRKTRKAPSAR